MLGLAQTEHIVSRLDSGYAQEERQTRQTTMASSDSNESRKEEAFNDIHLASRETLDRHHILGLQEPSNVSIEDQATVLFFKHFIPDSRIRESPCQFLELALAMFESSGPASPLHLATQALAVSVVAKWPGRRHLSQRSHQLYGRALNVVQRDLKDSGKATSDETLLTVLLFSLYESMTSSEHSVQARARHIEGAITIVKARGPKQFRDSKSLVLFRAVRTQMLICAIQQRRAVPEFSGNWIADLEGDDSAATLLIRSLIRLPGLLVKAKSVLYTERTPEMTLAITALLQEAEEIQRDLVDWETQHPDRWKPSSVANSPIHEEVAMVEELNTWLRAVHLHRDVYAACMRNNERVNQMLCSSVVGDALKWLNCLSDRT